MFRFVPLLNAVVQPKS